MGRFISRDPKEELAGLNLYAFVHNNPINKWDYLGMEECGEQDDNAGYGDEGDGEYDGLIEPDDYSMFDGPSYLAGDDDMGGYGDASNNPATGTTATGTSPATTNTRPGNTISSVEFYGNRIVVRDRNGNTTDVYPASSGRPGVTDPSLVGSGPIPPGVYFFDPAEISQGGLLRDLTGDWGTYRVPLEPYIGTDTLGRSGFFLHGGSTPGSAGCIDVGSFDVQLFPVLLQQPDPVLVVVHPPVTPGGGTP